MVPVWTDYFDH